MPKITTHYDTLKVTRDAPANVVKAAYKTLCQTYHPDKYVGDSTTADQMIKALSQSYAVLSDPEKRAEYDAWILKTEKLSKLKQVSESGPRPKTPEAPKADVETEPSQAAHSLHNVLQSKIYNMTEGLRHYRTLLIGMMVVFSLVELSSVGVDLLVLNSWADKLNVAQLESWLGQEVADLSSAISRGSSLNLTQSFLHPSGLKTLPQPDFSVAQRDELLPATNHQQVKTKLTDTVLKNSDLETLSSTAMIWQCVAYNAHPGKIPFQMTAIQQFLNQVQLKFPQLQADINLYQQNYLQAAELLAMPANDWKTLKICVNDLKNNLKKFAFLSMPSAPSAQTAVELPKTYSGEEFSHPKAVIEKCVAYNAHPELMPTKINEIQDFIDATQWRYPELLNLTLEPTLDRAFSKPLRVCLNDLVNQLKVARSINLQVTAALQSTAEVQLH